MDNRNEGARDLVFVRLVASSFSSIAEPRLELKVHGFCTDKERKTLELDLSYMTMKGYLVKTVARDCEIVNVKYVLLSISTNL